MIPIDSFLLGAESSVNPPHSTEISINIPPNFFEKTLLQREIPGLVVFADTSHWVKTNTQYLHVMCSSPALPLKGLLSKNCSAFCCCVSVLCRHHGLDQSNTRYSICMPFPYNPSIFRVRKSNSILDGCRTKHMIKQGSGRVCTLRKLQTPNSPCLSLFRLWPRFYMNVAAASVSFTDQTFHLACKNRSQCKICAYLNIFFIYNYWVPIIIYWFYANPVTCFHSQKLTMLSWNSVVSRPISNHDLNMYPWQAAAMIGM